MANEKSYLNLSWTDPQTGASRTRDLKLPVTIGRDKGNAFVLPTAGVSRKHCRIEWEGDEAIITDLESSNGTFLNGEQISKSTLSEGDTLTIGDISLAVTFSERRATSTSMDNLFDALSEGEAEATITLKSLKKKDLFAELETPSVTQPLPDGKSQTSEMPRETLSGTELKEFLSHGLQEDIDQDIAPDIDEVTSDMRNEHAEAMWKLQKKAEEKNAEPVGALNKFLATLRRLFGG